MEENFPVLISCKELKPEHDRLKRIHVTTDEFSVGRGLKNSAVIPFISISRNHCVLKKTDNDEWFIEDHSAFGVDINGSKLGKGMKRKLAHQDIITLEPSKEFVYKFLDPINDTFEIPKKRMRLNVEDDDILNDVKMKFEESQNYEIKHIEEKIQSAKQMQTTNMILKHQLQLDMNRKIKNLETEFAEQIENLKGEKNEVEKQKAMLIEERDAQLTAVKSEMEGKIMELMEQIQKHNETESDLLKENSHLKEKLMKEREEFLAELSRETSSKQDMLDKLQAKIREQDEVRLKEKQELEEMLRKETEQLRLAKEMELKQLEEQKKLREQELEQELNEIRKNLEEQVEETEQQRRKAELQLNEQIEKMKRLNDEEKAKMEQLVHEREEIQRKLTEAETNAVKSCEELKTRVKDRETELAALAAERIQKQAEQSSEVINSLQEQLEKVRSELQSVETEKNTLLESICLSDPVGEGTSKQTTLAQVGELIESELQCSICAELFVAATTLNCAHTFCKYCITMWKKKKKDCPICRSSITSECKSLVLDSFIEKMVQNLTEEMKIKRQELLKFREELEAQLARQVSAEAVRRSRSYDDSVSVHSEDLEYEGYDYDGFDYQDDEEEEESGDDSYGGYLPWHRRRYGQDSDSGSDEDASDSSSDSPENAPAAGLPSGSASGNSSVRSAASSAASAASNAASAASSAASAASSAASAASSAASAASSVSSASSGAGSAHSSTDNAGTASSVSDNSAQRSNRNGSRRRRRRVDGIPGSYYGGYGHCFSCGARGHWAPGCPYR